ncbi:MAG: Ppx/GppA phosphatase family protein [Coriobacteriia bacterium]|nr:Ppx/GppA phosphatase family protein [Coriobacteriia bacterium]
MRIAVIDIGTNSIRSRIVEAPVGGVRRTLDDEKAYTRIGRGLAATGRLSDEAITEAVVVLGRMLSIAERFDVTHLRAVATAAVREALNADEFVGRIKDELGLEVEVITAEEEGRLAFLSAAESIGLHGRSAVIDIGGGSIEVVRATDGQITFIASVPLGAVVLSERYHTVDPMPEKEYRRLTKYVRRTLRDALAEDTLPVSVLVGSGGTVSAVATLIAARRKLNLETVHTFEIRRAELIHLLASLSRSSSAERAAMKGLSENRVDIIVAGAIVLDEAMRALGANELIVNSRGMREGLVIDLVSRERGIDAAPDRMQSVRDFARTCNADINHAEQVCRMALLLFDELGPALRLDPETRYLLETAALLHDVGYHIAYERHHKHSYHLISYADLPGFAEKELRLIAAIARYHRGALPKTRHEALVDLNRADRTLVSQLAALLRLADGIDRSRGRRVQTMELDLTGAHLRVALSGSSALDVEVYGAQRKSDLFEAIFGVRVDVVDGGGLGGQMRMHGQIATEGDGHNG